MNWQGPGASRELTLWWGRVGSAGRPREAALPGLRKALGSSPGGPLQVWLLENHLHASRLACPTLLTRFGGDQARTRPAGLWCALARVVRARARARVLTRVVCACVCPFPHCVCVRMCFCVWISVHPNTWIVLKAKASVLRRVIGFSKWQHQPRRMQSKKSAKFKLIRSARQT
jgi:hypothetical protein